MIDLMLRTVWFSFVAMLVLPIIAFCVVRMATVAYLQAAAFTKRIEDVKSKRASRQKEVGSKETSC